MPRFFFHVRDGDDLIEDPEGADLPGLDAARAAAVAAARTAIAELLRRGRAAAHRRSFAIADKSGRVLATVTFRDVVSVH